MKYTIKELGDLAGVSSRTLRYYDQIGLLKPREIKENGYRIYGEKEVNRLQQILFYREFEFKLEDIKEILDFPKFEEIAILEEHHKRLLNNKIRIERLIKNISKTIEERKGGKKMQDKEKFEGLKQEIIDENEKKYGKEIREKYGNETVQKSYNQIKNMTEEEHKRITKLAEEITEKLEKAFKQGDSASPIAQEVAELHKQWISFYWGWYSKEAHIGIANMYVEDERFTKYYDSKNPGTAKFLRDAITIYASK